MSGLVGDGVVEVDGEGVEDVEDVEDVEGVEDSVAVSDVDRVDPSPDLFSDTEVQVSVRLPTSLPRAAERETDTIDFRSIILIGKL